MGQFSGPTSDLFSGLPFSEAELLAYVETDPSSARRRELGEFLQTHPDLRRALDAMREDQVLLCQIGDAKAPDGIVDEALAVLEREALLGEGRMVEPAPASIPIDRARPRRAFRALAMAAGFILLAGGASYWISIVVTPSGPAPVPSRLADATPGPIARDSSSEAGASKIAMAEPSAPMVFETSPLPQEPDSSEPEESTQPEEQLTKGDSADDPGASGSESLTSGIGAPPTYYPIATISTGRALELARERRLAIFLTPRSSIGRQDARSVNPSERDLPSAGSLMIELPATEQAIDDLCASLASTLDGVATLEELPEAFEVAAGTPDSQIERYWAIEAPTDHVTVPVMVD